METSIEKQEINKVRALPRFIFFLQVFILLVLHVASYLIGNQMMEITMGMNVELPSATQVSLMMIQSKLLLVILIVGSGAIYLNDLKNPDLVLKENLSQLIWLGLVILHMATIAAIFLSFFKLVNAT